MNTSYWPEGMDWRDYADECEACGGPDDHVPYRSGCSEEPAEGSLLVTRVTLRDLRDLLRRVVELEPEDLYEAPDAEDLRVLRKAHSAIVGINKLLAATPGESFRLVGSDLAMEFVRADAVPAWKDSLLGVDTLGAI